MKSKLLLSIGVAISINSFAQQVQELQQHVLNPFPGSNPTGLFLQNDNIFLAETPEYYEKTASVYNTSTQVYTKILDTNQKPVLHTSATKYYEMNGKIYFLSSIDSSLALYEINPQNSTIARLVKKFNINYYNSDNISVKASTTKLFIVLKSKLFVSDGTATGSIEVPVVASNIGASVEVLDNNLYFFANTSNQGRELWKSDGTQSGTTIVKDIFSGYESGINQTYEKLVLNNGKLIFIARESYSMSNIWTTDGTSQGTFKLKDINMPYFPVTIQSDQNKFLFGNSVQLWQTDGTTSGTRQLTSFSDLMSKSITFKNEFYFEALTGGVYKITNDIVEELKTEDGKKLNFLAKLNGSNTLVFKDSSTDFSFLYFYDGTTLTKTDIYYNNDNNFVEKDGNIYFSGYKDYYRENYTTFVKNTEIFKYNLLQKKATLEKDLYKTFSSQPENFVSVGENIFFTANDGDYLQLFAYNKQQKSIKKLTNNSDLRFGNGSQGERKFYTASASNILYYGRSNIIFATNKENQLVDKITLDLNDDVRSIYPLDENQVLAVILNPQQGFVKLYTITNNLLTAKLIVETPYTNEYLLDLDNAIVRARNEIFLKLPYNNKAAIWKTDGTIENTKKITDLLVSTPTEYFSKLITYIDNKLIFAEVLTPSYNSVAFKAYDETTGNITTSESRFNKSDFKHFEKNNKIYFVSSEVIGTQKFFFTELDPKTLISKKIVELNFLNYAIPNQKVKCGDDTYLYSTEAHSSNYLIKSDGTAAGTSNIYPTNMNQFPQYTCINNNLHFFEFFNFTEFKNFSDTAKPSIKLSINGKTITSSDNFRINSVFFDGNYLYLSGAFLSGPFLNTRIYELYISDKITGDMGTINLSKVSDSPIQIVPNPAISEIQLSLKTDEKIELVEIYDVSGRLKLSATTKTLDISQLEQGLYFVKASTKNKSYSGKLIKK
ncbi:Por secretion system C-terminal sorting domain-containing protein [Soonwooa buanensis]|uniref:Por secretion system C-terminal sorting domain-containing protein n=1 Tax=Soonwooa buanensis TaxID=619805 RepID=A0A1T5FRD8_9FLAO|nr:T9SS type A sorting domain-containing protein [Soonwooa buanensis]SKB98690.1 Por secretion system C-terminal sorting domain-containing protein [Soonwooa buanensis]